MVAVVARSGRRGPLAYEASRMPSPEAARLLALPSGAGKYANRSEWLAFMVETKHMGYLGLRGLRTLSERPA
jgi:hypothetical protein